MKIAALICYLYLPNLSLTLLQGLYLIENQSEAFILYFSYCRLYLQPDVVITYDLKCANFLNDFCEVH